MFDKKILSLLVYSKGEINGDGLIKLPFVQALRETFPDAKITWCVEERIGTVYKTWLKPIISSLLDEIITLRINAPLKYFFLCRNPLDQKFDLIIDTQSKLLTSLLLKRASKVFISSSANFLLSQRKPKYFPEKLTSQLETLLSLAAKKKIVCNPINLVDPKKIHLVEQLLPKGITYIGIAPGGGGQEKRWSLERCIALAEMQKSQGRQPVFILGPQEHEYKLPLQNACPYALFPQENNLITKEEANNPLFTIALATRFTVSVASNSGPGNMLAAAGTALVSLAKSFHQAKKFEPATKPLETLIAEEYNCSNINDIPLEVIYSRIDKLLSLKNDA
ncbi:MAG: hypothetical protein Q8L78_04975 [Coxiellaceae bacterium]|nr:hypothetical protein [Coxiellaceae bacterium]